MEAIRGQKGPGSCSYGCCELPDVDVKLWSSKISESSLCAQSSPRPIQHLPVRILLLFICFNLLSSLPHIIVPPLLLINVNYLLALPGCRGTDRILFLLLLSRFSWFQHLVFCYICWGWGGAGASLVFILFEVCYPLCVYKSRLSDIISLNVWVSLLSPSSSVETLVVRYWCLEQWPTFLSGSVHSLFSFLSYTSGFQCLYNLSMRSHLLSSGQFSPSFQNFLLSYILCKFRNSIFPLFFFVICISTDDLFDVTSSPYHSTLSNHSLLKSYIMSIYDVSVELTPGQLLGHS